MIFALIVAGSVGAEQLPVLPPVELSVSAATSGEKGKDVKVMVPGEICPGSNMALSKQCRFFAVLPQISGRKQILQG
ncbi:MAG: hypothetical protein R3C24_07750 [Cyanobacteriota/Melainabacteria group bacterium]